MGAFLHVIGTGSSGNGYIIGTDDSLLLVEAGIRWREYAGAFGHEKGLPKVCGCLVSHRHLDHCGHVEDIMSHGIPVYSCNDTAEKYPGTSVLHPMKKYRLGAFLVTSFPVPHNVDNYAYMIEHEDIGRLLFMTDLTRFPYNIKGIDTVMIEANYSQETIIDRLCAGSNIRSRPENHMSIDECLSTLQRLYGPSLKRIVLIHLSDGNSDERRFLGMVRDAFPSCEVYAARNGMQIEISKEEF